MHPRINAGMRFVRRTVFLILFEKNYFTVIVTLSECPVTLVPLILA